MSTLKNGGQTDICDLLSYIESYGSVRLQNCFRRAICEQRMPYATLDEYLFDSLQARFAKLNRIPNLGKKTATEFNKLAESYFARSGLAKDKTDVEPDFRVEQDCQEFNAFASMEIEPTLENRYSNLSDREKDIIERRFAISRDAKQTLEEIGQEYDVTRERIRQIESKALRKMRSPQISKSWKLYITENFDQLIDAVFDERPIISEPSRLSAEFDLAVVIVYGKVTDFLEDRAKRFEKFWVRPGFDILKIQTTRNRLAACVGVSNALPLSVTELAQAFEVDRGIVEAAVSALDGHRLYCGWVIRGNATSRKRRIVNTLNLFHERQIESPASLWDMKVAYWSSYDDKCSGRDLLLCLQEHKGHFINLRELGWVCLTADSNENSRVSASVNTVEDIPSELYTKPIRTGHGLANCVYEMFEKHGPQRLSDAAEIFQRDYPRYAVSSMYPMLVYFAVFLRFAPGIVGIQAHSQSADALQGARSIMLKEHDLDLYLSSRAAGPPSLCYPLWDFEMEQLWASWLVERQDPHRLGALLSVAKIGEWDVCESERSRWESQKKKLNGRVDSPSMRLFSDRRIDTGILTTALAAASVFGFVNWMYLNQALGWRIETTRVGLVLAVLIRIGVLKPTGSWSDPHVLTKTGRQISQSILGRSVLPAPEPRKAMIDFLEESVGSGVEVGWVRAYGFDQLLDQITDVSDANDDLGAADAEESNMGAVYEGFMGDELMRLIEGD